MIFTQEQINEIKRRLSLSGIKDSELDKLDLLEHPLTGKEVITIIKDGENLRISVEDLYEEFAKYIEQSENKEDFFNVSVYLGRLDPEFENAAKPCTLEEAINACPPYIRRAGQMISFLDSSNMKWETYQYIGTEDDDWEDITLFKNRYPVPADEVFDNVQGKKQSAINSEVRGELNFHTNRLNGLSSQNYITVEATPQTTVVTNVLPVTGAVDTVYRVGKWNGSQYSVTVYSEYAWDGTQYKLLDTKEYVIDDEPTAGSNNLVKSGGVYNKIVRIDNKLIKLTGFGANATVAGATEVDDCYFNTSANNIRRITEGGNEVMVPFIDGAIYTYNNELYTYNGTTLVPTTQSLIDAIGIINNDIFGISGSLQKDGTVSSTSGFWVTPFIPVTVGETIKVGGYSGGTNYNYSLMCLYEADKTTLIGAYGNDNYDGFAELEMTIPATAAYMRVGSRNDTSIAYMSRSYVHAKILSKLTENMLKAYFNTGENVNDISIDSVLSNNNHLAKGSAIVAGINTAKNELLEEISDLEEQLYGIQSFDNAVLTDTGKITFNAITLHEDGDELDIELLPGPNVSGTNSGEYALTFGDTESKIRVGISRGGVSIRADDNTWIYGPAGDGGTGSSKHAYKVKYTGGNIEIWKDTTLLRTYTGQKDISIYGIGSQGMVTKWFGTIYRFAYTHNGVTTELLNLTGFTKNDGVTINYVREGGDIPELQAQNYPKFEIHPTTDNVEVYFHLNKDIYGNLPIKHIETNTDSHYANFWGIENNGNDIGYICRYVNGSFVNLTQRLLVGAENEFAIQFYRDDFTGGTHGDERIDLDNTCYVVFIVDGKEYSISELIALGNIQCNSFSYRQRSVLYTRYEDTGTHDPIAYHMKDTEFIEGGYITRNNIEMLQAMTALNTYTGLVCVHKDIADYVVDNTGKVFTATHPSTASVISGISNKVDMRIRMYKGNASCVLDSKVVGGNVADFNTAPSNITIWDRQSDTKYYAVLPTNVSLLSTSVFGFETSVRFDYRDDV